MSQTVRRIELSGREIILVGTAHISPESVDEVASLIATTRPERVCVEIDEGRFRSMSEGSRWESLDIGKILKEGRGFLLLANLALSGFQRRMGSGVGMKPGEEMLAAVKSAEELGIPYLFCDRDVQVTLKRAWSRSSLWNRAKLIASLAGSAFSSDKLSAAEIERLKESNELEQMMAELAAYLPSVKEVLIDERDRHLASRIFEASRLAPPPEAPSDSQPAEASPRPAALAVVGAGHLSGIVDWLGRLDRGETSSTTAEIDSVPPPSPWSKVLAWAVPAIILALLGLGFLRSGVAASLALLLRWILLNGSLAALGSALCLAHPLTIVLSFLAAPIATLNPLVGVGLFAGLSEAFLRKPRVADFERLAEDVSSFAGFYRNRVTHILLVFFLSSFGGMAGNFIALPFLASGALAR